VSPRRGRPAPAAALVLPALAAGLLAAAPARAATGAATDTTAGNNRYIGIVLGSVHIGHSHLNDVNPGLTYGRIWPGPQPRLAWFAEAGVFYNSYREVSPLALFGARYDLGRLGPAEIRLGAATGIGYYRKLSTSLEYDYGIPNIEGFIPLAALSLSAQIGRTEYRLTTVPADGDVKAIFNLSVAIHF
jgi:hypothetical protein